MENLSKAYLLVGLCTFLYVQCVWSATQIQSKPPITSVNCTKEENCTAVDLNAVCGYTNSPKNCSCKSDYKSDGNVCVKRVLNDSCGKIEDCVHVGNATCDTNKCQCAGSFKVNGAACAKRVVGDPCKVSTDCPSTADCNTKICSCKSGYTAENGLCLFGVGASCTKKMECVSNADCDVATKKCACSSGFSASKALCAKLLNDSCGQKEECAHIGNATCDATTSKCSCSDSFKVKGVTCAKRVVGDPCKASADCPSNADCNTKKTCSCKSGYTTENGLCLLESSADSLKKTINAIVVSFLCAALLTII